jgi:hypothetical protein
LLLFRLPIKAAVLGLEPMADDPERLVPALMLALVRGTELSLDGDGGFCLIVPLPPAATPAAASTATINTTGSSVTGLAGTTPSTGSTVAAAAAAAAAAAVVTETTAAVAAVAAVTAAAAATAAAAQLVPSPAVARRVYQFRPASVRSLWTGVQAVLKRLESAEAAAKEPWAWVRAYESLVPDHDAGVCGPRVVCLIVDMQT